MTAAVRPPPTLQTDRLLLRPITHADVPALYGIFSDPAVVRYWSRPAMHDLMQARRLVSDIRKGYRTGGVLQLGPTSFRPCIPASECPSGVTCAEPTCTDAQVEYVFVVTDYNGAAGPGTFSYDIAVRVD